MKILHFADSHIGVDNYGKTNPTTLLNERVEDFLRSFDYIVDYVEREQVDLVLFAGDLFHKPSPSPALLKEVATRLRDIADIATLVIIPGNHDMRKSVLDDTPLSVLSALSVDNIYTTDVPCVWEIETTGGRVVVAAMPYPKPSKYVDNSIGDLDKKQQIFDQAVVSCLSSLGEEARTLKRNSPCFFVGHFTVNGCDLGNGQIAIDFQSYVQMKYLRSGPWDYVALGHIHKHQALSISKPPVIYSGSMDRVDFSETDNKGFVMIESVGPAIHWEFVNVPVRPMITLHYDVRGKSFPDKYIAKELRGVVLSEASIVRVTIACDYGADIDVGRIRKLIGNVHYVAYIRLDRELPNRETRMDELGDIVVAELDRHELLEVLWHTQDVPIGERDAMHELAAVIFEEVDDAKKYP